MDEKTKNKKKGKITVGEERKRWNRSRRVWDKGVCIESRNANASNIDTASPFERFLNLSWHSSYPSFFGFTITTLAHIAGYTRRRLGKGKRNGERKEKSVFIETELYQRDIHV